MEKLCIISGLQSGLGVLGILLIGLLLFLVYSPKKTVPTVEKEANLAPVSATEVVDNTKDVAEKVLPKKRVSKKEEISESSTEGTSAEGGNNSLG